MWGRLVMINQRRQVAILSHIRGLWIYPLDARVLIPPLPQIAFYSLSPNSSNQSGLSTNKGANSGSNRTTNDSLTFGEFITISLHLSNILKIHKDVCTNVARIETIASLKVDHDDVKNEGRISLDQSMPASDKSCLLPLT